MGGNKCNIFLCAYLVKKMSLVLVRAGCSVLFGRTNSPSNSLPFKGRENNILPYVAAILSLLQSKILFSQIRNRMLYPIRNNYIIQCYKPVKICKEAP
jgi:hypothetical protein